MPSDLLMAVQSCFQCLKYFLAWVWTKEKSAPLSTALAFLRESISPARASLRMSKYFSNQSQSAWRPEMYSSVAINSLEVDLWFSFCSERAVSESAFSPSLVVMDFESA